MSNTLIALLKSAAFPSLNRDEKVFIHPHIPPNKLHGAFSSYVPNTVQSSDILVLIDDTVFGGAKEGLALTEQAIYLKEAFESPRYFALRHIESMTSSAEILTANLYINGHKVMNFAQPSKQSIGDFARAVSGFISHGVPQTAKPNTADSFEQYYPLIDILAHYALLKDRQWNSENVRFIKGALEVYAKTPHQIELLKDRIKLKDRPMLDESIKSILPYIQADDAAKLYTLYQVYAILQLNDFSVLEAIQHAISFGQKIGLSHETALQLLQEIDDSIETPHEPEADTHHVHSEPIAWACGVLEISIHQITREVIQQAYRAKIKEFHPDKYQSLPESIQQMLNEKTQDLNKAKDILSARYS